MTENHIILDRNNVGSFLGAIAAKYAYTPALRYRLDGLHMAAQVSTNRYFVLDGDAVLAAQSTLTGALNYMREDRVLVEVRP
jgi:hypothetical protein